jgi:hypothetical protein
MRQVALCLFAAASLSGCDDTSTLGPGWSDAAIDVAPPAPTCSGTLTGQVTQTIVGCTITWTEIAGLSDVGSEGHIDVSDESKIQNFGFTFQVNGDAITGSFTKSNVLAYYAGVEVLSDGGVTRYIANYSANPMGPPTVGSVSVNITSAVVDVVDGSTSDWIVHGNAVATMVLPAGGPTAGTVAMSIVF